MSDDLSKTLEAITPETDFSDPNTYEQLLYGEELKTMPVAPELAETAPADGQPSAEPASEPAPAAPAPAESSAPAGAADGGEQQVDGVSTRDGKHVLPYAVLKDTREALAAEKARATELEAALKRMKDEAAAKEAGTSTQSSEAQAQADANLFTDEELAEMEEGLPAVAKIAKAYRALQQELTSVKAIAARPAAPAAPAVDVQALIDQRPLLAKWQARGGGLWQDCVALDLQLRDDPQWAGKTAADRFAEVERRIAADLGVTVPGNTVAAPSPQPTKTTPAAPKEISVAPTLTDLAGTPAGAGGVLQPGMSRGQMVDRAMAMSVEDIQRMVGVNV